MRSLQDILDSVDDTVDHFYNDTKPKNFRSSIDAAGLLPPEHTNWRDEQRAWRESAILFDLSHHMPELFISGPDSLRLISSIAANNTANLTEERAKQIVACTPSGYTIGDCIAYRTAVDQLELVSGMPVQNWIAYQAETGGYDVELHRDPATFENATGRRVRFRYQIEGPEAAAVLNAAIEGGLPEVGFFRVAKVSIAGCEVLMLRHGMAGNLGAELSGAYDDAEQVRDALLMAGEAHGLKLGGSRAYFSTIFESGWMPYPLPAIYTDTDLRAYRSWLPADSWEANAALGGSFRGDSIEDYYTTPWDLGYGHIINFDHDFIGRDALQEMRDTAHRRRVTLVWNADDVSRVLASPFGEGPSYKAMELPVAYYGFPHMDEVHSTNGEFVGVSCHCGFSSNERAMLSLAMLTEEAARPGTEVVLTWGEPDGGSRKPRVERHDQTEIRATVAPAPYSSSSGDGKRAVLRAR